MSEGVPDPHLLLGGHFLFLSSHHPPMVARAAVTNSCVANVLPLQPVAREDALLDQALLTIH